MAVKAAATQDVTVEIDLSRLRARDMSTITNITESPGKSWGDWAGILAQVAVRATGVEGDIGDPQTWLNVRRAPFEAAVALVVEGLQPKN